MVINMREIIRIDYTLDNIKTLWKKHPDLRFGQLFDLLRMEAYNKYHIDYFFLEEDQWNEVITSLLD